MLNVSVMSVIMLNFIKLSVFVLGLGLGEVRIG